MRDSDLPARIERQKEKIMSANNHPMSATHHTKAADAHEQAAKISRMSAASHEKGDHKAGLEHAEKALASSHGAHEASKAAHADSKTAKN
jgi:hypothetical protein